MQRGLFITIEGIEGVGKTTNIEFIADYLTARGMPPLRTREPGGTEIAEQVRQLLLAHHDEAMCEDTELLLVFAARAQHLQQKIKPALTQGTSVLCDRFTDATYAYQGAGRNLSTEKIAQLEQWVQEELRPDITILLDVPVALGASRIQKRGALDRFEVEQQAFFERVRQGYLQRAQNEPKRIFLIDASQPLAKVQEEIAAALDQKINEWQV